MNNLNDLKLDLKYTIGDIEIFPDYFLLQVKNESMNEVELFHCYSDYDCKIVYDRLKLAKRPMYFFSIDFDKVLLNVLCVCVELKKRNIIGILKQVSDFMIKDNVNFYRLRSAFWSSYFSHKKTHPRLKYNELVNKAVSMTLYMCENDNQIKFLTEFNYLFAKSEVFSNLIINSIPQIYYYYSINVKKEIRMTISLKKLQLIHEGYNIKFDFNKYTSIKQVKDEGLFDKFIEYSINDVVFLEKLFLDKPKKDIIKRFYAYKAAKMVKPDLQIELKDLYSENDTNIICKILKIDNPDKTVKINYTDYIKTNYREFNNFVEFINNNGDKVKRDRELKDLYCKVLEKEYIDDDKEILGGVNNTVDILIQSFDIININGVNVKFGLGGLHGAIEKSFFENLLNPDYTSEYPSVILMYKQYFRKIMNIELYEAIYKMRIESKAQLKETGEKYGYNSEEYKELKLLVDGLKLILNTAYGLINSNYDLPLTNKNLGRFICLCGQSWLLNLANKIIRYCKDIKLVNVNTDGLILQVPKGCDLSELIKQDTYGYKQLGVDKVDYIYTENVNSYIKRIEGEKKPSLKGMFNIKIKQDINKHSRLSVNTKNAIKLINGDNVEILPIYFDIKYVNMPENAWYFTTKELGKPAIKTTKKPEYITIDGNVIYFTDEIKDAKQHLYYDYAKIVKDKITNFTYVDMNKEKNIPYFEEILITDSEEHNTLKKKKHRELLKLFGIKNDEGKTIKSGSFFVGLTGYKGDTKTETYNPHNAAIRPLAHYKKTDILESTHCSGFSLNADDTYLIFDFDLLNKETGELKTGWETKRPLIDYLKQFETFHCWNNITKGYNCKIVFKSNEKIKVDSKYFEVLDKATIYSMDWTTIKYDCNFIKPYELSNDEIKEIKNLAE